MAVAELPQPPSIFISLTTDSFKQLQAQYLASFEGKCCRLEQALTNKSHNQLYDLAHKLTGSLGSYGFGHLSELSAQLENRLDKEPQISQQSYQLGKQLIEQMLDTYQQTTKTP